LRPSIWETGTGAEIIQHNSPGWNLLRAQSKRHHQDQILLESLKRPDIGKIRHTTIAEMRRMPIRPKEERAAFFREFVSDIHRQLVEHGDDRLSRPELAATAFATGAVKRIEDCEQVSEEPIAELLSRYGIVEQSLDPNMTIGDLGFLAIFARQLQILGEMLRPPRSLTINDISMSDLPSWLVFRELMRAHCEEQHVSASNSGDSYIAGVGVYADLCIVDKRTYEYLRQARPRLKSLQDVFGRYKKLSHYSKLTSEDFSLAN
jgi:hypothetical protein